MFFLGVGDIGVEVLEVDGGVGVIVGVFYV